MLEMKLKQTREVKNTVQYTPRDLAKRLIDSMKIPMEDSVLDPCKGDGSFYDQIPNKDKRWCEINEGRDFFDCYEKVDWVVSNPPFSSELKNRRGKRKGLIWAFIEHSVSLSNKGFGFLINNMGINVFTNNRLNWLESQGFKIVKIEFIEVKEWYGRFVFVIFSKEGNWCIDFKRKFDKELEGQCRI